MAEKTGDRILALLRRAGAWLYGMAFRKGWPRWVFLAVAIAAFLLIVSVICGGVDYKRDPSALVPHRSTYLYAETRALDTLLKDAGSWNIWRERRGPDVEQWSQMQVLLAEMIGRKVEGLGTRLPLLWLSGAKRAAVCFTADEGEGESWALYLEAPDAAQALAELRVEAGLTLEKAKDVEADGVYQLTGNGGGTLFLGITAPWLILSSDGKLPQFAADSLRKPAFSLANSRILPGWGRDSALRGMINPSYFASQPGADNPLRVLSGWMAPEARWSFASSAGAGGDMRADIRIGTISDQVGSGGIFWPVVKFILFWIAILCLLLVAGTISVMIGLGGWYKYLAAKAGVAPKAAPEEARPSGAFKEDAGVESGGIDDPALLPVPVPEEEPASAPEGDGKEREDDEE